jgi:hypothetical protein
MGKSSKNISRQGEEELLELKKNNQKSTSNQIIAGSKTRYSQWYPY